MPQRTKFVEVTVKSSGEKQVIPARWLDNPTIAAGFDRRTTKQTRVSPASSAEVSAEAKSTEKEN